MHAYDYITTGFARRCQRRQGQIVETCVVHFYLSCEGVGVCQGIGVWCQGQVAVLKGSVRQAMTEWIQRRLIQIPIDTYSLLCSVTSLY